MTATTLQISSAACDARFLPETIDVDKRTVEVVASTGARVLRGGGWFGGEPFWEELRVDKSAIRLERLNSGRAPVLDSHMAWRLGNVLGVVVRAWIANGELHALLRMSGRNAEMQEHWTGIREGTLANISLIYRVHEFVELDERGERDFKVRQAADWEPLSVDFVPIGADAGAGSRAEQETNACLIRGLGDSNQEPETMPTRTEEANTETPAEQAPETARTENTETPPAPTPQPTPTRTDTAPAPSSESAPAERAQTPEEVLRADRERRAAIRRACEAIGVQRSVSDELEERVEGGRPISADRARTILFERLEEGQIEVRSQHASVGVDESTKVRAAVTSALCHRTGVDEELVEGAREFRGMSMLRLAEELLQRQGVATRGMGRNEIARSALHSVADFPVILGDVANKNLRMGFEAAPQGWLNFARRNDAVDFKTVNRPQLGEITELDELKTDDAEIKYATIGEQNTTYALSTYAKRMAYTRQMIVNDDTDAFSRFPQILGNAARETHTNLALKQITGPAAASDGPTMGDGKALFHADHANTGTGVLGVASLASARAKMRAQTGINGLQLNILGKWLLVNGSTEILAAQLVSELKPTSTGGVNPFGPGGVMSIDGIVSDSRLDADSALEWYLVASPSQIDVLEYAHLEGSGGGPMVETKAVWERDAVEIRILDDFAVAMLDWRGIYRSSGS